MSEQSLFQQIAGPPADEVNVDLIFVHGLKGDWERTWCGVDNTVRWPQHLLPNELPSARIFTYGVDVMATDVGPGQLSRGFRKGLEHLNEKDNAGHSIIFVAHSLGGLVIQDALMQESKIESSYVMTWTTGIIFLGTPCFTNDTEWLEFGRRLTENSMATEGLETPKLAQLSSVSHEFRSWKRKRNASKRQIWCFYETLPVYRMGILVPKESAILNVDECSALQANHFDMSKFDGPWDQNYQIFCAKLRQMSVKRRSHAEAPKIKRVGNPDNRHIVIRALESYHETRFSMIVALTLEDQGHSASAKSRYQDIIAGLEKEDQVVLFCREKVSSIQWSCGHYEDAENMCRGVVRMQTALLGRSHSFTFQSIGTLALILLAQGKSQEAYSTLRDVLEEETEDPYQDIAQVRLVGVLATVLRDLGFIDLSLLLSRSVYTACGALLDSDHPFTLARASDLAEILARKGHIHFAEEVDRHVLGRLLKASGIKHPEYLNTASQLANHLRFQCRYKEAIDLFESTLRAQETQVGPSNPSTAATRCGLAATHALQGHLDESENLLRQNVGSTGSAHDRFWTAEALQCLREFKKSTLQDPGCENDQSRNPSKLQDFFKNPIRARYSGFAMYENIADTLNGTKRENCRLRSAAMSSNDEAFAAALDQGANVRLIGGFCGNALHAACFSGNQRMVRRLLQLGVDNDAQGGIFGTPLRAASFSGHTDIVELLLKAGADPNTKTKLGESALQAALATNRLAVAQILLSAGADYNDADSFYGTPLHEASMAGQQDMVRTLLDFGADPNVNGGFFGTALRAAAWKGDSSIVECLLKKGARLDTRFEGRTAFSLAAANENEEVVKILVTEHTHPTNSSDSEYMSISIKEPRMMTDNSLKMSKNLDPRYNNGSKPRKKKRKQIKKVINRYFSAQIGYLRKI